MSIIPAYLNSFSSVAPLYRGTAERAENDRIDRHENVVGDDKAHKTENGGVNTSKRSAGALGTRSGDFVSSYGDVFSLSRDEQQDEISTQGVRSKEDTTEKLTDDEKQQVSELKQRDAEVKAHEAAHLGAAGGLARGGASYEYQKGPDGRNYAVGGEVSIDSSPVTGDQTATIAKAQQIRRAALAPENPSSQDYKIAAKASKMEAEARQELSKKDHNSSDSSIVSDSQTNNNSDKTRNHLQSQYITNTAVTKYAIQAYRVPFVEQADFQTFA